MIPFILANSPQREKENRWKAEVLSSKKVCLNNKSILPADTSNSTFTHSLSDVDTSEVTVEFTPGMTTKRRISKPSSGRRIFGYSHPKVNTVPEKILENEISDFRIPVLNQTIIIKKSDSESIYSPPNASTWRTPKQNRLNNDTYRISSNPRRPLQSAEKAQLNIPDSPQLLNSSVQKVKQKIPELPCLQIEMINPQLHQKLLSKMKRKS